MFRALSSSLVQIYNIFARNANCVNILKHFGNVKRRVLHKRASAMCYITRHNVAVAFAAHNVADDGKPHILCDRDDKAQQ